MYRCRECQAEYEIKPDYCDCGNDTFDEICSEIPQKTEHQPVKEQKALENEIKKIKPEPSQNIQFKQQSPQSVTLKKSRMVDIPSLVIFSICILLSFVIVFFIGNPKETDVAQTEVKTVANVSNIPTNIDKLWNNKLPKNQTGVSTKAYQPKPTPQPPIQVQQPVQIQPQQITQNVPKTQTKTQPKTSNTVKVQKNNTIVQPKTISKTQTTLPKTTQTTAPKTNSVQVQQPKSNTQPTKVVQAQQPSTVPKTITTQTSTVNRQELSNYKIALRNRIANNINFANVIGDGTCAVTFKITSSGAITNKKFAQQSDNFTLNDVVHNAVFNISAFNPPPAAYKGETMRLTVKMHNGNFSVSLN